MKNEKMTLNHMILYCKGWYKRSNCVWKDLSRCIVCDGQYTPMNKEDVAYVMLMYVEKHIDKIQRANGCIDVITFLHNEILNTMRLMDYAASYKRVYEKNSISNCYLEAMITCCSNIFRWLDTKVYDKVLKPCEYVLPITDTDNIEKMFEGCDFYDKENKTMEFAFTHYATKDELKKYVKENELEYNN